VDAGFFIVCDMRNIIVVFLLTASVIACTPVDNRKKIVLQGAAQGTYYAVTYYDSLNRDLQFQIDSLLKAYDLSASNYVENSIISKVNRNEAVTLDSIFTGNFLLSQKVSEQTGGDFDITVRPLVELWGFGKKKRGEVTPEMVDSVMAFTGYKKVRLENGRIVKDDPRIKLDFNAVAQGYSVDVVAAYLKSLGINDFLVDIGGEVYASGTKPLGQKWKVGIERPKDNEKYGESLSAKVSLQNKGMATSGNYRKFYVKNGVKYSHTIDPHTGYPAHRNILSATIIAADAAHADAYATACMVMGIEKAKAFLENHPELEAFLIYSDEDGDFKYYSKGLENTLVPN